MRFDEIKKNKDPRIVKPRDPNFKTMMDLKKSGAAGSHGDKTKIIPRKEKHRSKERTDEVVPLLWAGAIYGHRAYQIYKLAQALRMANAARGIMAVDKAVKGANAVKTGEKILRHGKKLRIPGNLNKPANNVLGKGARRTGNKIKPGKTKNVSTRTKPNMVRTAKWGSIASHIDQFPDIPEEFWNAIKKYGLSAAAAIAIIYGGKKLYDYFQDLGDEAKKDDDKNKNKNKDIKVKEDGWKDDYKISRLLGKAQASMTHGLELADAVVKGDKEMAVIKARVIKENWPDLIHQLDNVYKDKKDLNSIEEYVDDRVGTVVKTSDGHKVKILDADPKKGVYKVEFQNGTEVYMTKDELDLEVPTDAFGKNPKPRDWKHPWDSDPREEVSEAPIEQDRNDPIAKPYVDKPEWKALHDMDDSIINAYIKHKKNAVKEDIDSPAHNSYSAMWHKSNPIGRNFMDPDDYDADAEGTHILMHQPTEQHFYKIPAKNYDEAFDKWLDDRGNQPSDSSYYDSTKDYASDHEYWGRIAPDEPEPEDDDETEALTNEEITKILEGDFGVKDLDDYKAKIKTLYGLERYMKSDPDLASEVKKRYRQLAKWKFAYDKAQEENYESQLYDALKNETATAGATSAGSIATVVNPTQAYGNRPKDKKGLPKAPQKKNPDGTAKNALDISNNLMGGATVKR